MNLYHAEQLVNFVKKYIVEDTMIGALKVFIDVYNSEPDSIKLVRNNVPKEGLHDYKPL